MNTYKVYIRYRGHVEHKYESAINEFEAQCQAMRYFKGCSVMTLVRIKQ